MMVHLSDTDLAQLVKQERDACAALADAMAERRPDAAEALQAVAAQIRARP